MYHTGIILALYYIIPGNSRQRRTIGSLYIFLFSEGGVSLFLLEIETHTKRTNQKQNEKHKQKQAKTKSKNKNKQQKNKKISKDESKTMLF